MEMKEFIVDLEARAAVASRRLSRNNCEFCARCREPLPKTRESRLCAGDLVFCHLCYALLEAVWTRGYFREAQAEYLREVIRKKYAHLNYLKKQR